MKIFITGNLGYVGSTLTHYLQLRYPNCKITGYDAGYFKNIQTVKPDSITKPIYNQIIGDVRDFNPDLLKGFDVVIHLAAISNDPIGNKFEAVTMDVNYKSTINIAKQAIANGITHFVFASSCSVYGTGGTEDKTELSPVNPLTAYAHSKLLAENGLAEIASHNTAITCLRFATACGMSNRLRLDLVLNDFVASALTNHKIEILSDGSPWRPLIDVEDMAAAFDWAMHRKDHGFMVCNAGTNNWNFNIKEIAEQVSKQIPGCVIQINSDAPPDKRSYKVNFSLYKKLAGSYYPTRSIETTIHNLISGLQNIKFAENNFRQGNLMRLNTLNQLLSTHLLDNQLYWKK